MNVVPPARQSPVTCGRAGFATGHQASDRFCAESSLQRPPHVRSMSLPDLYDLRHIPSIAQVLESAASQKQTRRAHPAGLSSVEEDDEFVSGFEAHNFGTNPELNTVQPSYTLTQKMSRSALIARPFAPLPSVQDNSTNLHVSISGLTPPGII